MTKAIETVPARDHVMNRRGFATATIAGGLGMLAVAAPMPASAASRVSADLSSSDRQGIEDLFVDYSWAYDCSDLEGFLNLFTDDGLVVGLGKLHRGKPAMADWFRYLLDIRDRGDDLWLHEASQHKFVPSPGGALVYSYATHFNYTVGAKTYGVRSLGYFVSECVKSGDHWKFRRFSVTHWDKTQQPWKKPLPWAEFES